MKYKSGISLIATIITIIIIVILSSIIILSLLNTNMTDKAKEAKFKSSLKSYENELLMWLSNEEILKKGGLDVAVINASKIEGTYTKDDKQLKLKDIITSIRLEDENILEIKSGKLIYIGENDDEIKWAKEIGLITSKSKDLDFIEDEEILDMIKTQGYIPISTVDELNNIRNSTENYYGVGTIWEAKYVGGLDKNYVQVKDIDLKDTIYSEGKGWLPIGSEEEFKFTGKYDGKGFKIKNLKINRPDTKGVGLFGYTNNADIKNVMIDVSDIKGYEYVGALVGYGNNSKILLCHTRGGIVEAYGPSNISATHVGGIAGRLNHCEIILSSSTCDVTHVTWTTTHQSCTGGLVGYLTGNSLSLKNWASGSVLGGASNGGLIGLAETSSGQKMIIEDCYSSGDVNGTARYNGGLIGQVFCAGNRILVNRSYAIGRVNSTASENGGLIGRNHNGTITSSYFDKNTTGKSDTKGIAISTVDMKKKATFIGWNFNDIWKIEENITYPTLYQDIVLIDSRIIKVIEDAHISISAPNDNYGNSPLLRVLGYEEIYYNKAFLKFNMPNIDIDSIDKVELFIFYDSNDISSREQRHRIKRVTENWDESTITWNNAPSFYGSGSLDMGEYARLVNVDGHGTGVNKWRSADITILAKEWMTSTYENYGLVIDNTYNNSVDGGYWASIRYRSKEYEDSNYSPYIKITFKQIIKTGL